jgi:hypothetical protein
MKITAILLMALLTGCTSIKYGDARYVSVLNRKQISSLSIESSEDGKKKIVLKGYRNDQVEALAIAVEAAVAGALKGVK